MLTLVTGAAGFVGRALVQRAAATSMRLRLVDRALPPTEGQFEAIEADLTDVKDFDPLLENVSCVIHLAALPGGAAEAAPELSKTINLDLVQRLIEETLSRSIRFVHASSIAVFGSSLPDHVGDQTEPCPSMVYGKHKRLAEIAVQEAENAISIRLPAIVARPRTDAGFKSGFMSDVFWAVRARERYVLPVSPHATFWLMSAEVCAQNLLHAANCSIGDKRAMTLPALRARAADLVANIAAVTGGSAQLISYEADEKLEEQFGRLPPLSTPLAESLGFKRDAGLPELVRAALRSTTQTMAT